MLLSECLASQALNWMTFHILAIKGTRNLTNSILKKELFFSQISGVQSEYLRIPKVLFQDL